jgi:hypothetical protein
MLNLETQSKVALHGYNPDVVGAGYVHSGCAASGTVGTTTVNIASGRAYTLMTDGTVGCIVVASSTQTTVTINTTYNLYLQPDGTFYWSTSNSPQSNSVYLATVATDGSGNISSIADKRPLLIQFLPGAIGSMTFPPQSVQLGNQIAVPVVTGMSASAVTGSGLGTGAYKYVVTFAADGVETLQSAAVTVTTTGGNNQVSITGIPTSADPRVQWRKLYRTAVGGSTYTWVATFGDNSTTTYTDAASDASISSAKVPPAHGKFGGTLRGGYPWSAGPTNSASAGTINNAPTLGVTGLVTGDATTCMTFANASSQYISCPTSGLPVGNSAFTVGCLLKFAANPASNRVLFGYGGSSSLTGVACWIDSSGKLNCDADGTGGIVSAAAVSTAATHHAAVRWDGTTLTLLLDGVSVGTPTTPGMMAIPASPTLNFGANTAPGSYWTGQLQYGAIFGYALSTAQALKQFNLTSGASGSLTYALQLADDTALRIYSLGDASGTVAAESSRYATVVASDGQIQSAIPLTLDRGLITSDGAGALTSRFLTVTGNAGNGDTVSWINGRDTSYNVTLGVGDPNSIFGAGLWAYDQKNSGFIFDSATKNGISFNGAVKSLGGQATAGSFGVPVIVAVTKQQNITNTTLTNICSWTSPGGSTSLARVNLSGYVGGANTNAATMSLVITWTDPNIGTSTTYLFAQDGTGAVNAKSVAQGGYMTATRVLIAVSASTTVTLKYLNTATGTISDFVHGSIEVIA